MVIKNQNFSLKKNMSKIIIVCLLISLFCFRAWQASGCASVRSFLFNNQRIITNVETSRQYENNPDGIVSKATHNKFTSAPYEFLLNLSALFDPRYLLELVSPVVFIGVLISIYSIVTKRKKVGFVFLAILILAQIRTTLFTISKTDMLILCLLWFLLSFWSLNFFAKSKKRFSVFVLLWLYSVWFFFISWQLPQICNEIFFK